MPTEESKKRPDDIIFKNPEAVAELEAAISLVCRVKRGKHVVTDKFDLDDREHWLSLITWNVDGNGRAHANILVLSDKDVELDVMALPFSTIMYQPRHGQTDVCLCFVKFPENPSPEVVYEVMAVPLGGAFSSAMRMTLEDAIDAMGGMQLGLKTVNELPALPPDTWEPNSFGGKIVLEFETVEGRRGHGGKSGGVISWFHGKCVVFEGAKPPANMVVKGRVLREDFRTITVRWLQSDTVAATPIIARQHRNRGRDNAPAVEPASDGADHAPPDFETPTAGQAEEPVEPASTE